MIFLSFLVKSTVTGTHGGALTNSGQSRSYPFTYTISSANTWEQKSITIPLEFLFLNGMLTLDPT